MKFNIEFFDSKSKARAGTLTTPHGEVKTPVFMPVGTRGTVKAVHQSELEDPIGARIVLGNTYHLYLRPGTELIVKAGGLHKFISWGGPMLTDSGGFQIYSLSKIRKINEEGVSFRSHIDGSKHFLSPERAIEIQRQIGADIIMSFDECTPYPCSYQYARNSMELTHRWLDRCLYQFNNTKSLYEYDQFLIPIVQGSTYSNLRRQSAEFIASKDSPICAIGGLSVGEPAEEMYTMSKQVCEILPESKPRYLMGVGTPANILECISNGVDMFDCVLPTRNARHGLLYTKNGIINIKNKKWSSDLSPIDEHLKCPTSNKHSKAYLRHLFKTGEYLAAQIASIHNLSFYQWLMKRAREEMEKGNFLVWKNKTVQTISRRL